MEFSIRTYRQEDFKDVLLLCQNNLLLDVVNAELLNEKIYGDPFHDKELIWIAQSGDRVVGFLMGVCRKNIRGVNYGYVKLIVVDSLFRRKGIARNMYLELEKCLDKKGMHVVRMGDVPMNYFMPGIDPGYTAALCFAKRMGFHRFSDTSNMRVNLMTSNWTDVRKEEALKADNIEICRSTLTDKEELMAFLVTEWQLWQYELEMAYRNSPITVHVAKLNGVIKAFSAHSANNKSMPWFGPMGTDPGLRGSGIGKVLLYRSLKDLKELGYEMAVIPWVGPIDFYSHHAGAVVERVFWRYEKEIADCN